MAKEKIVYTKEESTTEVYSRVNKKGVTDYYVRLYHNGTKYPQVNYTSLFGCQDLKATIRKKEYVHMMLDEEGIYLVDKERGTTEKQEIKKIEQKETKKLENTFDFQFNRIVPTLDITEETRSIKIKNYNRHIKPYIGGMNVYDIRHSTVSEIFNIMSDKTRNGTKREVRNKNGKVIQKFEAKVLSIQTQKNVLSILNNVFNELIKDDYEFRDFLIDPTIRIKDRWKKQVKREVFAPLDHRLKISSSKELLEIARQIYKAIDNIGGTSQTKAFLYTYLMTARRRQELWKVHRDDIEENLVYVGANKNKTSIYEKFFIPEESIQINNQLQRENPFKISASTNQRAWNNIKKEIGRDNDIFRSHDFRHLFVNIMGDHKEKFNRYELAECISHSSGDATKSNDHYFTLLLERKKQIFEEYWKLLRN